MVLCPLLAATLVLCHVSPLRKGKFTRDSIQKVTPKPRELTRVNGDRAVPNVMPVIPGAEKLVHSYPAPRLEG